MTAVLFGESGLPVMTAQREFPQIFSHPGWVEHDAQEIWNSQLAVARELFKSGVDGLGLAPEAVTAIGITNQRETTVLWDRSTGTPLANAIVWQDRRTADRCAALHKEGRDALIQSRTGLVLDAYFSGTKLQWLLDTIPGARTRAQRGELAFGTIDSWLVWNLTGGRLHVTDASNASRTLLFNLHTMDWDDTLLSLFDIPRALLPRIVPTSGVLGQTDPALFGRAIPIASIVGDQQGATFGQACFSPGMAKTTYGTGCFMLMNTGQMPVPSHNRLLTTVGWQIPEATNSTATHTTYCLEASVFMGGATIQWLRDGLNIIRTAPEVEGIALQVVDVFNAMAKDSGISLAELRVDGGASQNNLLMQMQADFLGIPVVRPHVTETTALGAAYLAGLATGIWSDTRAIAAHWSVQQRFEPNMSAENRAAKLARWHQALSRAKGWARD